MFFCTPSKRFDAACRLEGARLSSGHIQDMDCCGMLLQHTQLAENYSGSGQPCLHAQPFCVGSLAQPEHDAFLLEWCYLSCIVHARRMQLASQQAAALQL
jgi:hypothetical protein